MLALFVTVSAIGALISFAFVACWIKFLLGTEPVTLRIESEGVAPVALRVEDKIGEFARLESLISVQRLADASRQTRVTLFDVNNLPSKFSGSVQPIREIALQTNLLALTAAIDTARARAMTR